MRFEPDNGKLSRPGSQGAGREQSRLPGSPVVKGPKYCILIAFSFANLEAAPGA